MINVMFGSIEQLHRNQLVGAEHRGEALTQLGEQPIG